MRLEVHPLFIKHSEHPLASCVRDIVQDEATQNNVPRAAMPVRRTRWTQHVTYLADYFSSTAGIGLPFHTDTAVAEAVHLVSYARAHAPADTCIVCLGSKTRAKALNLDACGLTPHVTTEPCDNCDGTGKTELEPFGHTTTPTTGDKK